MPLTNWFFYFVNSSFCLNSSLGGGAFRGGATPNPLGLLLPFSVSVLQPLFALPFRPLDLSNGQDGEEEGARKLTSAGTYQLAPFLKNGFPHDCTAFSTFTRFFLQFRHKSLTASLILISKKSVFFFFASTRFCACFSSIFFGGFALGGSVCGRAAARRHAL